MNTIYKFPGAENVSLGEVGGKGLSLIKGIQQGLPVPPGFVLTTEFFRPCFDEIFKSREWAELLKADTRVFQDICAKLKGKALSLKLTETQKQDILSAIDVFGNDSLFAVRSSSPEEDLEGTSFAGGYETVLGVTFETIEVAVVRAFASCLDYRVFVYKKENGFDIHAPKIAVVVQRQIASETAGVGFSINPLNNSFDQAVINSNWGLGESVVSGTVSPDTFVVDKNALRIIQYTIGKKEKAIWLDFTGGTHEESNFKSNERTLSDKEVIELCELIRKVECIYGRPMDIEWAFSKGVLYLLQARPVTAFVPVPPEMMTSPGEGKYLYLDATISVQGLYKPMSNMATSIIGRIPHYLGKMLFWHPFRMIPKKSVVWTAHGRLYINLSKIFAVFGKDKFASFITVMDSLASETIKSVDEKEYKRDFNAMAFRMLAGGAFIQIAPFLLRAFLFPKWNQELSQRKISALVSETNDLLEKDIGIEEMCDRMFARMLKVNARYSAPIALLARKMLSDLQSQFSGEDAVRAQKLSLALPHNITTEMDFELYRLAAQVPDGLTEQELLNLIRSGSAENPFVREWNSFLGRFGHRCAAELDLASPRYRDKPEELLRLIVPMHISSAGESPIDKFDRQQKERGEAFEYLHKKVRAKKGAFSAAIFRKKYEFAQEYAGYREMHKYLIILAFDIIRRRMLREAEVLCRERRLEYPEQVFDLTYDELCHGLKDKSINLSEVAKRSSAFIRRLEKVRQLPTIFDSRGLILRPPKKAVKEGEIAGSAISSGKATGKIKVLNSPTEKPFLKGEILVARATDPGWTPLFVNACAVVLEVGGVLQHGALVAREYGLPCVAGVENAIGIFKDGMTAEVDGTNGVIRIIG